MLVAQQMGLFGSAKQVYVDDATGGIAYYTGVFSAEESAALFDDLQRALAWSEETMWMYDHTVAVPRLIARFEPGKPLPPQLAGVRERVESFLDARFNAVSVQYYRTESDSVAWHSDHTEALVDLPVIAVLSLGATRPMQIRSKLRPRRAFAVDLEPGSLLVMSGRAQEHWEHHIPKLHRPTTPRVSIALRQQRA